MGCNTSKESVQPAAEEAKEETKNGDVPKSAETVTVDEPLTKPEADDKKEEKSEEREDGKEGSKENQTAEKKEEVIEENNVDHVTSDGDKESDAATRIQAAFRGHHARKSMKETESSGKQTASNEDAEPTKEQLEQEFREDDKELCNAATKIQASFRGHMSRKEQAAKPGEDFVDDAAAKIEEKVVDALNELEGIDLSDPDLHKAATKIQASFRGHKVRQEVVPGADEKK